MAKITETETRVFRTKQGCMCSPVGVALAIEEFEQVRVSTLFSTASQLMRDIRQPFDIFQRMYILLLWPGFVVQRGIMRKGTRKGPWAGGFTYQ